MSPYKFSPSSLSLLKECSRCFWLKFNKDIKRPQGIFPSLPSGMDKILKEYFDNCMKKGKLPKELRQLKNIKLFDDEELLKVWRSNFKGIRWEDKEGNLFRGAVDNILKKGNKLIVIDYKTRGYPLKDDTADHYQDQLDIYNLLLRKNSYETEDYAYLLFYYPDKVNERGDIKFHVELVKMKINTKNAENIFKKAKEVLKNKIPKNKDCEYCGYKEDV